VGVVTQGAAVWLPGDFLSGAQQGRINPKDGQLYVSGMYGWGCYGSEAGCFQRVRYTGGPAHLPVAFEAHENGVLVKFSDPLGSAAADAKNHFAQCWNYRYSAGYGSPEFSVRHPDAEGHDPLEITSAHLLDGGKSLFLEIPLLTPCNVVHVHVGTIADQYQDIYITAHKLAPIFTAFPGYQVRPKQYILADKSSGQAAARLNPWAKGKPGRELRVEAALGLKFAQTELTAKAGERLTLTFANPDAVPHNWVLISPGKLNAIGDATNKLIADPNGLARHYIPESSDVIAYTDMTNPGGSFTINFKAPDKPGLYPYLCTFPGHWVVMNGVLKVE
jgi:azurin